MLRAYYFLGTEDIVEDKMNRSIYQVVTGTRKKNQARAVLVYTDRVNRNSLLGKVPIFEKVLNIMICGL